MVLIANEVMQEGLDLHKYCRRVVHHDLVWNPAQIEQRIGRIDRLGSLTSRLRQNGADVALDILYPVIRGTIDKRLFRTVKTREKWLEFLLGAAPNFSEYSFTDEEPAPLPDRLGADLAIDQPGSNSVRPLTPQLPSSRLSQGIPPRNPDDGAGIKQVVGHARLPCGTPFLTYGGGQISPGDNCDRTLERTVDA